MSIDLYESALKKAKENDRANRDANRTTRLSGGSASSGTVDLYESALKQAKERDKQPKKLVSTAQQRREEGGGTPAIFNAAGASRPGSVTQQITSAIGRMNDRGLIDTVTSSDSWDTTGEAETALKAWESQLDTLSSQVSQQERQLESAQRQLEQERESLDLNDADAVARFNQRVDEVSAQYGEYERIFDQFDTVRSRYESGIGTYHDMLIAEGGRAQNYRDEAERLAGETEQLAAELDRYRSGDVYYDAGGSGINTAQRREQLERQIEENESEIKRLRSEADRAQWAYYSGLALNEDYAERSAPLGSQREAQIAAGESPFEAGGAIYDYINNIGNAREIRGYDAAGNEMQALGTMTDEEIGLYNYIYATQGREAAAEYLNRLREAINARLGQQRYENMSGIGRALYWIPAGINQFTSGIRQLFSEEAVPTSPTQYTSQAILEGLEGRPVASTLYELGTTLSNMAPSILASALGGWALGAAGVAGSTAGRIANLAGSALLGASAGGNAYTQKINEGYLPDEARDYSTLVGLSEGALQYVLGGIEGLGGEAVRGVAAKVGALDNVLGRIARSKAGKLVMNMISEGTEEGLQELLEPAFATLVLGEEYDANFEDAAYAFLLGALSAGVVDTVTDAGHVAAGKRRGVNFTFADMDGFIGENGVNYFEGCNTYAEVEARYRELARENHPDLGGDTATMAEINRQHSMARAYFQGRGETAPAAERSADTETGAAEEHAAGPDGVVRALSAPATAVDIQTPANTQEGVQRATGRVTADGGIILPTADEPGGLVLPTAEDFERAGSPENLTGGNINGRTEQTDAVSGRDGGRLGSGRSGGQAGQLAEGTEGRPAAFEQSRTALERQNRAGHLRLEEVSTHELGVPEGTDTPTVRVLPEEEWDDELQKAAEDVYWRTGKEVEYVLGALEVYGSDGSTRRVRGVWREDGAIIIQADNMRVSAQQIAEHETYHEIAAQNPGTDYAVEERIREQFGDEEFERVVEIYIQKLHGIVDLPANADGAEFEAALARVKQEIYADAYAGINAFGAHAERFRDVTRETVEERTRGEYRGDNEEATRSTTGPPETRYSLVGETEDGVEIYETSEEVRALPWKERKKRFVDIMRNEYRGRTARFDANGEVLYARFDDEDISKNIYGDKKSSKAGLRAKINLGADGDIFDLVERTRYAGSSRERGKQTPAHKDVTGWEYFVKKVRIDGRAFDLLANVRKKPDGEYVYSIQLKEDYKTSASPQAPAYGSYEGTGYALDEGRTDTNSIRSESENVNRRNPTDADELPVKARFSVDEETADEHMRQVQEYFGVTDNWNEAGYITRDGQSLDFSGRHEGGIGGYRTVDHREISDALGEEYGGEGYSDALVRFMDEGNIRISPESGGINLSVRPTAAQEKALRNFISEYDGEVTLNLDNTDGVTVSSTEYPRGTRANKVISDIRSYFETGETPRASDAARYRFSVDEDVPAEREVQPGSAVRYSTDEEEPRPVIAKRDLKRNLLDLFSVPSGSRAELGRYIEGFADRMIRSKEYTEEDRRELFDRLYDEGVMTVAADPYLANAREWLVNRRMYVNDSIKHEFGGAEDWNEFRKRAFAAGIYFTNNLQDMAPDMWQAELGEVLPGLFDSSNLDMKQFMERVVQIAEESRDERVSLAEYTQMLANENYVSEDEVLDDLEQRVDWELRTFAEKAELETKLRGRGPEGLTNSERQRVIQEERDKYWQLHRQYQEETRQRIREEKDKRHASEREARQRIDNIIREEREKYWQRRREYQQRADQRVREERERRWAAQADARRRLDENQQEARRTYYEQLERYRAARKATDARERERRKQMAERRRETRELRDLQQRTLKQIQWLARNQYRAPEELRQQWDEVLGDLDIFAVSAANEMNYSKKYGATWRDLAEMYKDARKHDPNFMPSQELERIVARLDNDKIGELDIGALQDLYKAAVGLRTEFYNRNNVINDEMGRLFSEVYKESKAEIDSAPGGYTGKPADRVFNLEQLTPMNVLERMAGWNPNSTWYSMARQLEKGERDERAYIVQANRQLEEFLRDNEEWVMKSDGQGKDAVWYEIEVPELLELGMGDKPIFGDTVKVYMTPAMKVQLYLESKNYDNLRHMVGGRTFPDKKLYSEGKRAEAWKQGTKVRLAPETVRRLVENLTPEEQQLASVLERYYNQFAAERINAVSNVLYGYDRAVTRNYAPIYTDSNYNRTEIGKYDQTAEGVGNMKERVRGAKNPSYNISAYDAFERHVDQTARFVGMAIPARNWQTLLNWGDREDSMMSVITHKWGGESLDYIKNLLQDLQGGRPREEKFAISSSADKFWSNYITAIFGANPSIIIKQLGSIPLGGAYLGVENVPSPGQLTQIDRELISKYTSELDWRLMGYATPETKQLKEHPNWTQRNMLFRTVFGGGAITGMDGWAASTLWPWAENKVRREQPELEVGTQEQIDAGQSPFYRAVAAEFNTAVNRSQSMSDTMHNARIRKSSKPVLRALTMFKSDAAQTYNAFRQTIGEAQYYKKNNADTRTQSRARRAIGAALAAWILNAAWGAAINYLINLWKRKGDNYRDEEGELTAESVLRAMVYDMVGSLSGVVVYGEELSDIIGSVFTGERWYGMEAPAIEQLNDILEALLNSGNSIRKVVDEAHNIASQGGDLGEYFSEHSGEIISGVQDIASKAAMYFAGLPASNVEAYVLGALRWLSPELVTAYEDALGEANRASLEGLEDDALVTRVRDILSQRLNEVSELTAQTVATLYTAGYSNALPSNTPSSVSVKGEDGKTAETVEFDAFKQQFYNRVWTETAGTAVDELTAMPEFEAAGTENQVKMLRKVYDYADGMAKAEVVDGYQPSNTILNAAEEIAAGASLAEWALYDVLSADVSGNFDRAVDQGLDYESALEVAEAVEDAGEGASSAEKYLAVAELPLSELDKEAALEGIMSESAYERYSEARAAGIDTYEYCAFLADAESISGDGRQERIWALIDGMALSRAQKDALHLAAGYKDTTLSKAPWNK